jgi:hypothetical protein
MAESVTLELPADVARRARAVATATNRRMEDVVVEWIGKVASEPPVESLSDADVLELSRVQMGDTDQIELSALLGRKSELLTVERTRLDELLAIYRLGLKLKARALKEAVARSLIPRLNGDGE